MHLANSCSLKQCPCRRGCAALVTTISCCAFDCVRDDRDAAQECGGDSRSLAATLNCLAGDWIDRTALAARWLIPQLQKPALPTRLANSAPSLKQAVFGHLREF